MKKILTILFIFIGPIVYSQTTQYRADKIVANDTLKVAGSSIGKISKDTLLSENSDFVLTTQKAMKVYIAHNGSITDTTHLSDRINQRVKYSDSGIKYITPTTASQYATTSSVNTALSNKLNIGDTATMLSTYAKSNKAKADSITLAAAINGKQASGNYAIADSSLWQTKYRSDSSRSNIYNSLNSKVKTSDTALMLAPYARSISVNSKLNSSDTSAMLDGRISSITLNATGSIHATPITFTKVGGVWSGSMVLNNQSPYTIFNRSSGTGVPSWGSIDSSYFGGKFQSQVRGAQNSYTANLPIKITSNVISADTGRGISQLPTGYLLKKVTDSIAALGGSYTNGRGITKAGSTFGLDTTGNYTWNAPQTISGTSSTLLNLFNNSVSSQISLGRYSPLITSMYRDFSTGNFYIYTDPLSNYGSSPPSITIGGNSSYPYISTSTNGTSFNQGSTQYGIGNICLAVGSSGNSNYLLFRSSTNGKKSAIGEDGSGAIDFYTENANANFTTSDRKMKIYSSGNIIMQNGGTFTDDGVNNLQVGGSVKATQYRLSALNTAPASATDTGTLGEMRITSGYIYICTATNTWVRAALATW